MDSDFMFQCHKCKEKFSSSSLKDARNIYRRHAKKHELGDFPLRYIYTRWKGQPLNCYGLITADGDIK